MMVGITEDQGQRGGIDFHITTGRNQKMKTIGRSDDGRRPSREKTQRQDGSNSSESQSKVKQSQVKVNKSENDSERNKGREIDSPNDISPHNQGNHKRNQMSDGSQVSEMEEQSEFIRKFKSCGQNENVENTEEEKNGEIGRKKTTGRSDGGTGQRKRRKFTSSETDVKHGKNGHKQGIQEEGYENSTRSQMTRAFSGPPPTRNGVSRATVAEEAHANSKAPDSWKLCRKSKDQRRSSGRRDRFPSKNGVDQAREFKIRWPRKTRGPSDGEASSRATLKAGPRPPKHSRQDYGRYKGPAETGQEKSGTAGRYYKEAERRKTRQPEETDRRARRRFKNHGPMLRLSLRSAPSIWQGRAGRRAAITTQ